MKKKLRSHIVVVESEIDDEAFASVLTTGDPVSLAWNISSCCSDFSLNWRSDSSMSK